MSGVQANSMPEGECSVSKRQSQKYKESNNVPEGRRYDTRPGWKQFVWNPETYEFLGRTASSWAKIILFYVVFYLFLAGFFTIMMIVFFNTLSPDRPKYTAGESLLSAPTLTMRPNFYKGIMYDMSESIQYNYLASTIDMFIERHKVIRDLNAHRYIQCDGGRVPGMLCDFDVSQLTRKDSEFWGYDTGSPTMILKLNKLFDWEPVVFERDSYILPEGLRQYINDTVTNTDVEMVWVWCSSNVERLTFSYSPQPGFPSYYYPFYNQQGYLAPLVAVTISELPVNQYVKVTCTAYAKNLYTPSLQLIFYLHREEQEGK